MLVLACSQVIIIDITQTQVGRGVKMFTKGIKIVKKYLKCIKSKGQIQSTEEMKEVKEQAMDVLQRAITAGLVRF